MVGETVIIAGAGIGGLTTALSCQKIGRRVRVFERAPELGEIGAGIMLTPNAVRCLEYLGLGDALSAAAVEPTESIYRKFDTSEVLMRAGIKDKMRETYGAGYYLIHRADLHSILMQAVQANDAEAICPGFGVSDADQNESGVDVHFENGESVAGNLLIGCDGIHSAVRGKLFGKSNPQYTGQSAWRGMVPVEGLPESVLEPGTISWIGEDKHVIQYAVRQGRLINYVAIVALEDWAEEGWNRPAPVEEVVAEFAGWHADVLQLLSATPPDNCYKWGLFVRESLKSWTVGRVTLLGDAAHPTLPFAAQGSAMAIEDAVILGRALASYDDAEAALKVYESTRLARTTWLVEHARQATKLYQRVQGNKSQQRASSVDEIYSYDAIQCPLGASS
ncbi:MAG: NAD(P)-binding protein [Rhodospirillaceae bacterium]|jgi:salicylate hydroxylase|nr:NAD(P)-binding protein [Rhodospirillaceae bacterium]MBT5564813.1 NAD(P)-binding protein [Rhodospirillaceae bacterium]MBT6088020.1 NAD(P)-binding protein [Rhodospirillaceae bacterium]